MEMTLAIANTGTHAWLRCFERRLGICIGHQHHFDKGGVLLELNQKLNFSNEPRAFIEYESLSKTYKLTWNDFGLFGPSGPMPELLSEQLMHQRQGYVFTLFINRITQRIAQLYYRAWAMQRPECEVVAQQGKDQFSNLMANICSDPSSMAPHFHWQRLAPTVLPLHVKKVFGVDAQFSTSNLNWHQSEYRLRLGEGKISKNHLGACVPCYSRAFVKAKLIIKASNFKLYGLFADKQSNHFRKLCAVIHEYLPQGARCELKILESDDLPSLKLSHSRLSKSKLKNNQNTGGSVYAIAN